MENDTRVDDERRGGREREDRWAILLIAGGILLLAGNLGWFGWVGDWLWAVLFLGGGAAFLYRYSTDRKQWWPLIPGFALAAIGLAILLDDAAGPVFLGLIGLAFLSVYLTGRERWWAVIPAGVLLTLAVVALIEEAAPRVDAGWIFFLGLAATFGFLYYEPEGREKRRWALYPAVAALALALLTFLDTGAGGVVVPLALIAVGGYLIWRQGGGGATQGPPSQPPAPSPEGPRPPEAPGAPQLQPPVHEAMEPAPDRAPDRSEPHQGDEGSAQRQDDQAADDE